MGGKQPVVDHYDFGEIIINGKTYRHDVVVTPDGRVVDWWRIEGHRLQLPDVRDFIACDYDAVVVGTGYDGLMRVDEEVVKEFRRRGAEVFIGKSRSAVRKYNELVGKGKKVLLLIHLTC